MPRPTLFLGGIEIPAVAGLDLRQTYEPLTALDNLRMADGALSTMQRWTGKVRTQVSGQGWIPHGLSGLTLADGYLIKCAAPRAIGGVGTSNVVTLPAARRSDADALPYGIAIVGGNEVATPVNIIGNQATMTTVAGATQYQCWYYPEFTARIIELPEEFDGADASWPWSMSLEQV